ncbi:MAG TPA: carboxypeptidase-like regulatory domain-containing protein [Polyangiaceae bacterium]|nr:carboxypeptidase-like regulatory domain-containing protein [Polyangiaceae bacterium]
MLKPLADRSRLAAAPWLALAGALALSCSNEHADPSPLETVPWDESAPELRIVAGADGMHLVAARSSLQPGARVHVVNTESGEIVDGTAEDNGSFNLLVPGGSQDDYEVTVRKIVGERRAQEAVLTLAVPSLEDREAALGPCNCADVRFASSDSSSASGTVHRPLECEPGFCTEPGCYPGLDAWQAELCAQPSNGAILRWEGCGLVQLDFALGPDTIGAFGNEGRAFRSFDAASGDLVGFFHYSDGNIGGCEPVQAPYVIHGRAIGGATRECAEATACVVCGSEPGYEVATCPE